MATPQNVLKTFMATLDTTSLEGSAAVDSAVKSCSNFSGMNDVISKIKSDCQSYISADSKNGWKNFLLEKCGINLSNTDTGAITGKDAGGSKVKTAESIIPGSGSVNKNFTENSFSQNGLTFNLEKDFDSLSPKEQFIWQGLYTWWAKGALDLIKTSYGYSFKDKDVYFNSVTISFKDDDSTTMRAWNEWHANNSGKVERVTIVINMRYYKDIDTTNPNGYSSSAGFYLDKTLAHELTHTLTYAKVLNGTDLPKFIKEGLGELTIGIDDERASDITYLAKNPSVLFNNLNGKSSKYSYEAGYIFFRYLAKQSATGGAYAYDPAKKKSVMGTSGKDSIDNSVSGATIQTYGGNDYIYNSGASVSIVAGAGKDSVFNHAATVTIDGGNDADYISNFAGKVTIYGGAGKDSLFNSSAGSSALIDGGNDADYISNSGNKVTIRGGDGNDTIKNWGASVSIDGGNSNDRIYSWASSKVTLIGGDGADYIDNRGVAASMVGGNGNDTLTGYSGADTLLGGADNDKLYGNAGADKLYGGNENDTLSGGAGNDSLWGGAGKDTFIYKPGEATDKIMDYSFNEGDMLTILKSNGKSGGSFTDSKFSGSELTLTISGGGTVIFKSVRAGDKFNINNKTYTISGSKLK